MSCQTQCSGGASKLLIDHIIPLYLTALLALPSLGSYIFTVCIADIYAQSIFFIISGIAISRRAWQSWVVSSKAVDEQS